MPLMIGYTSSLTNSSSGVRSPAAALRTNHKVLGETLGDKSHSNTEYLGGRRSFKQPSRLVVVTEGTTEQRNREHIWATLTANGVTSPPIALCGLEYDGRQLGKSDPDREKCRVCFEAAENMG